MFIEADAQRCSVKKMFLEISQNSHENADVGKCGKKHFVKKVKCLVTVLFKMTLKNFIKNLRYTQENVCGGVSFQ